MLNHAKNYKEWKEIAEKLDKDSGVFSWREDTESDLFHSALLGEHILQMRDCRDAGKGIELISLVQESLSRHSWELNNPELYDTALSGTKFIISEYFDEIEKSIQFIVNNEIRDISLYDKLKILIEGNRIHGSTALLLSGGASFGIYHLGVVKALLEENLIPRVMSGASMGAIVAAMVCTHTNEELRNFYAKPEEVHKVAIRFFNPDEIWEKGTIFDQSQLWEHICANLPDYTFQEAYQKTNRVLNISVSATRKRQRPRVLNHLTTPNLLIRQSVLASCSVPGIFPPSELKSRNSKGEIVPYMESETWIDGSVHLDIPMKRIIRLHNVSRSIVSQANPHVVPFVLENRAQGLFPFFQEIISTTLQMQIMKLMELGVELSEKFPWLSTLDKFRSMMEQDYVGDINIYYPMTIDSITKIVANPTEEEFLDYIRKGELQTWPKIEFIRDQMKLNRLLEEGIDTLQSQLPEKYSRSVV